jgi:hypothetical protein
MFPIETTVNPCYKVFIILSTISLQRGHCGVVNWWVIPKKIHIVSNSTIHSPPLLIGIYFGTPNLQIISSSKNLATIAMVCYFTSLTSPLKVVVDNTQYILIAKFCQKE